MPPPPTIDSDQRNPGPGKNFAEAQRDRDHAGNRHCPRPQRILPAIGDAGRESADLGRYIRFHGRVGLRNPIAAIGHTVQVSGRVTEFSNLAKRRRPCTELVDPFAFQTIATGTTANLSRRTSLAADLSAGAEFDRLERYEGMLVGVPETAVVLLPESEARIRMGSST